MTDVADPVRAFRDALKPWLRSRLHITPDVVAWISSAVGQGHTPIELAEFASYRVAGLDNAEQVMRHRLRRWARPEANDDEQ